MGNIVLESDGKVQTMPYTLKRRNGKRGITIRIFADGSVVVSASSREPIANIEAFLLLKQEWIMKKVALMRSRPQLPQHTWTDGDVFPFFGNLVPLRIERDVWLGRKTSSIIVQDNEMIIMTASQDIDQKKVHDLVIAFYRERALSILSDEIPRRASELGLPVPSFSVIDCYGRWGSCSSSKKLSFAVRIATLPVRLIEYLVLHELAHLVHFNHGSEFKALLSSRMPDWRKRQKELYEMQALSDLRLYAAQSGSSVR